MNDFIIDSVEHGIPNLFGIGKTTDTVTDFTYRVARNTAPEPEAPLAMIVVHHLHTCYQQFLSINHPKDEASNPHCNLNKGYQTSKDT